MNGNAAFEQKIRNMISFGAALVCTASVLATQQFMMNIWQVLFFSGLSVVMVAIFISKGRKMLKKKGYVRADSRYLRGQKKLKGKRLKAMGT